jgi:hypothetical protein
MQFPGILPDQEPRASAALLVVRDLCPELSAERQIAVAARIAVWSAPSRTLARSTEIAANDATRDGISTPVHIQQVSRDVLRFAARVQASDVLEPLPVLEPITTQVRQLDPAIWGAAVFADGQHIQAAE